MSVSRSRTSASRSRSKPAAARPPAPVASAVGPENAVNENAAKAKQGTHREVRAFDPSTGLVGPHRISFVGPSGAGKSSIMLRWMYECRAMFPVVIVFSGSEGDTGFYGSHVPPLLIHTKLRKRALSNYIRQRRLAKLASQIPQCLAVFDDVFDAPGKMNNRYIKALYKQGRGLWAATWVATQHAVDLQPWGRANTSLAVLSYTSNAQQRKTLFNNYGCGLFESLWEFNAYFDHICKNSFRARVLACGPGASSRGASGVYWYATSKEWADNPMAFRMCHPEVWKKCNSRTDFDKVEGRNIASDSSSEED